MALGHIIRRYKLSEIPGSGILYVEGVQIGRFGIHEITDAEDRTEHPKWAKYAVDHINTGKCVLRTRTFEDAVMIADDLSRFSRSDPSSRNREKVIRQLGPSVARWIYDQYKKPDGRVIGYREWLRIHGG